MATEPATHWLKPLFDPDQDPLLGAPDAPIMLVEYGSYACPHCRAAHERIIDLRDQLGDRVAHAFRHRPVPGNELAMRAAELAERAAAAGKFWKAHVALMTRSADLREEDLDDIARELDLPPASTAASKRAAKRVQRDIQGAEASGVMVTPTFFINGRRHYGPYDIATLSAAVRAAGAHALATAGSD